jgi:type IV secretory pathway VirJ component
MTSAKRGVRFALAMLICACQRGAAAPTQQLVEHGQFQRVHLISPARPSGATVVLTSDAQGWNERAQSLALQFAREGALVVGVDTPLFFAKATQDSPQCILPGGDLENLARFAEAYSKLPGYQPAILVGLGMGASMNIAAQLQAPARTFAGTIALNYCDGLALTLPLCPGEGLQLRDGPPRQRFVPAHAPADPLYIVPAADRQCASPLDPAYAPAASHGRDVMQLYAALAQRAQTRAILSPRALEDLPLVEVEAAPGSAQRDQFAIMLSGDGGWAAIDRALSTRLAAAGIPVAGIDSLRYFWGARTPQRTADDVTRLWKYYRQHWQRSQLVLVGFSQGADVLPFVVNRLAPSTRTALAATFLLSIGKRADFEFHLKNWVGTGDGQLPILPELLKLADQHVFCVYGTQDVDTVCPQLPAAHFGLLHLPGSHHFDGHYDDLARLMLEALARPR